MLCGHTNIVVANAEYCKHGSTTAAKSLVATAEHCKHGSSNGLNSTGIVTFKFTSRRYLEANKSPLLYNKLITFVISIATAEYCKHGSTTAT